MTRSQSGPELRFMTMREAADSLCVSVRTLYRLVAARPEHGHTPATRSSGAGVGSERSSVSTLGALPRRAGDPRRPR